MEQELDLKRFLSLRDRYLDCVDARVRAYDNYCKGRDFAVRFSYNYARNDSFFIRKSNNFNLDIPSYVFDRVDRNFKSFISLLDWFEKYVIRLEKIKM